jgi:hypothetical protein
MNLAAATNFLGDSETEIISSVKWAVTSNLQLPGVGKGFGTDQILKKNNHGIAE